MNEKIKKNWQLLLLLPLILFAAILRYQGNNWDEFNHLHPDERYITIVATQIRWPESFSQYLDPETSPLSPYNTDYKSYIYGTFPLFFTKAVADQLDMGDYNQINLVGRAISATLDLGTLLLIFWIGNKIYRKKLGLIAAGLYAFSVIAIQQSHFFTVESYETFFITLTFALLIKQHREQSSLVASLQAILIGISFGFALASKISALLFIGVIAYFIGIKVLQKIKRYGVVYSIFLGIDLFLLTVIFSYLSFRLLQPYAFADANWLILQPQPDFWRALNFQRQAIAGEVMFPPSYQWYNTTPYLFPLINIVIWGLGIGIGVSAIIGMGFFVWRQASKLRLKFSKEMLLNIISLPLTGAFIWIMSSYIYRGGSFVKSMRYFFALVPFLTFFASYGLYQLNKVNKKIFLAVFSFTVLSAFLWSLAFSTIYQRETTRVSASNWIYENLEAGATYANEHWDDPLPVRTESIDFNQIDKSAWPGLSAIPNPSNQDMITAFLSNTTSDEIEVYNPDDGNKVGYLYEKLNNNEYLFISSDRARGSIGELPDKFPFMVNYYQALDDGSLGFQLVAEITSYPSLFGIEINDEAAEEVFWIYDHPTVRIYRKQETIDLMTFSEILTRPHPT